MLLSSRAFYLLILFCTAPADASIKEYSNKTLHLKAGFDVPGYDLVFKSETREIKFQPNFQGLFSVGVSVQGFLGVNWGFRMKQTEEEIAARGDTEYEDYRLNVAFEQFHVFLSYGQYRGFFVEDSKEVDSTWTAGEPYYRAENLASRTAAATFTWVFSPDDISLIAAMDQTARQERSGGSWLAGASFMETVFKDDAEIIPTEVEDDFGPHKNIKEGRFLAASVKGGYGYTLAITDKWFFSIAGQVGFGAQRMSILGTALDETKWASANKYEAFGALGWNGDDNFFGLTLAGDGMQFNTGEIQISSTLYSIKLFYGLRI